ncbi:MAG TPA: hypothetical protein VHS09_09250 [Polyangiaceae bacterium]|jgi:hypothetical protein|nr:hypothetical protein [Polyangiaceae bacterium]
MNARALPFPIPVAPRVVVMESSTIRWNDGRARWLLEHAAAGLGVERPALHAEEFEWATTEFSDSSAMTLYLAARSLADAGRLDDALEVLGDACRAQRCARPTMRELPARLHATG